MKSVLLALGTVVLLGCVEQPNSQPVAEPSPATVFDELAAAVDQALAAKILEEDRLAQFGVEKQRLVSRLMPNGDWGDGQRNSGTRSPNRKTNGESQDTGQAATRQKRHKTGHKKPRITPGRGRGVRKW